MVRLSQLQSQWIKVIRKNKFYTEYTVMPARNLDGSLTEGLGYKQKSRYLTVMTTALSTCYIYTSLSKAYLIQNFAQKCKTQTFTICITVKQKNTVSSFVGQQDVFFNYVLDKSI